MRFFLVAALWAAVLHAEDITVPLDDGSILIRPQFIRVNQFGNYIPELSVKLKNQTSHPWRTIKLQFEIGGFCNGQARQWSVPATTSLGWAEDHPITNEYTDTVISLVDKVDGCKTEVIKARLILAENPQLRINGLTGERVDLEKQLQEIKAKRDAEEAAQAEEERVQAEKDAAAAARKKRLSSERRKKEAEEKA